MKKQISISKAWVVFGIFASVLSVAAVSPVAGKSLALKDADAVGLKYNTGESVQDTPQGIRGSANGILKGGVNLLFKEGAFPLFITEGPLSNGVVQFGFINHTNWPPRHIFEKCIANVFNELFWYLTQNIFGLKSCPTLQNRRSR